MAVLDPTEITLQSLQMFTAFTSFASLASLACVLLLALGRTLVRMMTDLSTAVASIILYSHDGLLYGVAHARDHRCIRLYQVVYVHIVAFIERVQISCDLVLDCLVFAI